MSQVRSPATQPPASQASASPAPPKPATQPNGASEWRVTGKSVLGAQHKRIGLPNQDAIGWTPETGAGPPVILALADGHGSPKCFRSDTGAQFAVKTAIEVLQKFLNHAPHQDAPLADIKKEAEEHLARQLEKSWKEKVKAHFEANPFTVEELTKLEEKKGAADRQKVEAKPETAYGATLIVVAVTRNYILFAHIGDGDILMVWQDEKVTRPWPVPKELLGLDVHSLSETDCWTKFHLGFQEFSESAPALILASTDGWRDSYADNDEGEKYFYDQALNAYKRIRANGLEQEPLNLERILNQVSEGGVGDDTTAGIIKRTETRDLDWLSSKVDSFGSQLTGLESKLTAMAGNEDKAKELAQSGQRLNALEAALNRAEAEQKVLFDHNMTLWEQVKNLKCALYITLASLVLFGLLVRGCLSSRIGRLEKHSEQQQSEPTAVAQEPDSQNAQPDGPAQGVASVAPAQQLRDLRISKSELAKRVSQDQRVKTAQARAARTQKQDDLQAVVRIHDQVESEIKKQFNVTN